MGLIVKWHVVKIGWNPNNGDIWGVRSGDTVVGMPFSEYRDPRLGDEVEIITDPETGVAQIRRESHNCCERKT